MSDKLLSILVGAVIAGLVAFSGWQYVRIQQLTTVANLFRNCPLPAKGNVTVIEAEWPGQASHERYRCTHLQPPAKKAVLS